MVDYAAYGCLDYFKRLAHLGSVGGALGAIYLPFILIMNKKRAVNHNPFSWRSLYDGWMRFGKVMNKVMTTILFSVVYFFIVSLFALWKSMTKGFSGEQNEKKESFWISKAEEKINLDFFQRMG